MVKSGQSEVVDEQVVFDFKDAIIQTLTNVGNFNSDVFGTSRNHCVESGDGVLVSSDVTLPSEAGNIVVGGGVTNTEGGAFFSFAAEISNVIEGHQHSAGGVDFGSDEHVSIQEDTSIVVFCNGTGRIVLRIFSGPAKRGSDRIVETEGVRQRSNTAGAIMWSWQTERQKQCVGAC